MNLFFICTHNICRSKIAQDIFAGLGFSTKSGGILDNFITENDIKWADKIVAMEEFHKDMVLKIYPEARDKLVVLGIPDIYCRGDPDLTEKEFIEALVGKMFLFVQSGLKGGI